jgi:hypothetical protein
MLVGLEMDAKRMSLELAAVKFIVLALHVAVGAGAGLLFFRGLWWNTRLLVDGGPVLTALALIAGRFLGIGSLLTLTVFEGAAPLLATALGIFIGRFFALRAIGTSEP